MKFEYPVIARFELATEAITGGTESFQQGVGDE